ncbi:transposable element Tcb2 transposase [Trichonephila clavipes]|nr:transposable element Tcb2 transposase [Trichonephila clavipes]
MSPIEHEWDIVGRRLARDLRPVASTDELWLRIQTIWNTLPQTNIKNLFNSMPRRVAALIAARVTEFDCPRIITSTIARLRTEHLKGMKIHPDKTRSYVQCKHCPDLQLTPNHILECPTVATKLLKMGMVPLRDSLWELLYSPDAPRIAEAVIKTFDGI